MARDLASAFEDWPYSRRMLRAAHKQVKLAAALCPTA
jgi:hypothetical protein